MVAEFCEIKPNFILNKQNFLRLAIGIKRNSIWYSKYLISVWCQISRKSVDTIQIWVGLNEIKCEPPLIFAVTQRNLFGIL